MKDELITDFNTQNNTRPFKKIVFTGHSLGAAVSTVAGHHFSAVYPSVQVEVWTFGSPKVGNKTFVKEFKSRIHKSVRIYARDDPITMIPCDFTYKHVDSGICLNTGEDSIYDHQCANYALKIIAYANKNNTMI